MHRAPGPGSLQYVSWKLRKAVAADLRRIYTAPTAEAAADELERFAEKWDKSHPAISQIWRRNWPRITPFFAFAPDIRKVIYTTNAVESLNMTLRKVIKTRASCPNEEAAIKLLYLGLLNGRKEMEHRTELARGAQPVQHHVAGTDAVAAPVLTCTLLYAPACAVALYGVLSG